MKFTVKENQWYRGKGCEKSFLLSEDGMRCCIGFVGQQVGISDDRLINRHAVISTHGLESCWPEWMKHNTRFGETIDILEAYTINDHIGITDAERKEELKLIFARNGDELEFIP